MKRLVLLLSVVLLLQSCMTSTGRGVASGAWTGGMVGSALGGILGGRRGHDIGTVVGVIAGAATGAVVANANEQRRYNEYVDNYNSSSRNSYRSARQLDDYSSKSNSPSYANNSALSLRNLRFIDNGGNQVVNRGEDCKIIFELANTTNEPIYDVVPFICESNGNSHVTLSPSTRIEVVKPGDVIRYTCSMRADNRLKEGTLNMRISVSYEDSDFITLREFTLKSAK